MGKITIQGRSDGKTLQPTESSSTLHLVPARCIKTKEGLLVRLIKDATGWCWDSMFRDGTTQSTQPSSKMEDIVFDAPQRTSDYFSCPCCGVKHIVKCNTCHQISCWSGKGYFTCAYCGNTGEVTGQIQTASAVSEGKKK